MALKEYRRRRDFSQTAEPEGGKPTARRIFVVQKHAATRLHYDFRLQVGDVLVSWAVPRGPSYDPAEKRLAVHVEDHPFDYKDFEGTIPQGEYGGGTVIVWDQGTWEPVGDAAKGIKAGKLKFHLNGERLQGGWTLVRLRAKPGARDKHDNWLLIKERDEFAKPLSEGDILDEETSIVTGRSMDDITAGKKAKKRRAARKKAAKKVSGTKAEKKSALRPRAAKRETPRTGASPAAPSRAKQAVMPRQTESQLATLAATPPEGDEWLHEIKWDGYRMFCRVDGGQARFISRNQQDWTARMRTLATVAGKLPVELAILDGEVVVLDDKGISHFQSLQNAFSGSPAPLVYYAFDLLYLDGWDLREAPLVERKRVLKELLDASPDTATSVRYSDHMEGSGAEFLNQACQARLEGTISKRRDAPYLGGRGTDWLKNKCRLAQEFVIGGWTDPTKSRMGFGALLLGCHRDGKLVYAGRVGTGFSDRLLRDLSARLKGIEQKECPFDPWPLGETKRGVHWVKPTLVAQVEFANWTDEGLLRQAAFQGLREDKPASKVTCEVAVTTPESKTVRRAPTRKTKPKSNAEPIATSVRLSSPDRVVYPDVGLTKKDVFEFYAAIADWMLPHLANRPLSIVRCPEGSDDPCFFQKHPMQGLSEKVKRVPIEEKDGAEDYMYVVDRDGLLTLVQFGVLEFHTWGSQVDKVDKPDRLVFDLDPDPGLGWPEVIRAAREVRKILEDLGLQSFVKNSGGKGLHVVVPIDRRYDWKRAKAFTKRIADDLARDKPDRYVANMSKAQRKGKIFIDYLRNDHGSTSIAAYSTRARAGAAVSVPLTWEELSPRIGPDHFTVQNLPQRLAKLKADPWENISSVRQTLPAE